MIVIFNLNAIKCFGMKCAEPEEVKNSRINVIFHACMRVTAIILLAGRHPYVVRNFMLIGYRGYIHRGQIDDATKYIRPIAALCN